MLVNKQYGWGILAVVGHKIMMEILQGQQKKIDQGANVLRVPLFGLFNIEVNVNGANPVQNREDSRYQKMADTAALFISIGNSFTNPVWTVFSSLSHILLKTLKIGVKNENMNHRSKQQIISLIFKAKYLLVAISAFILITNPFPQEIDPRYLKR